MRPFTIAVEGNIGAGKSTLVSYFKSVELFDVFLEPIDQWQNVQGKHNLLQLMYDNPISYGFTFQMYEHLTRVKIHTSRLSKNNKFKIMERSIFTARHCFIENLKQKKVITDVQFGVLDAWFRFLTSSLTMDMRVDLIVYLRTTPRVAWDRVKLRARDEEKDLSLEYIETIHSLHETWLLGNQVPCKVLVLDGDQNSEPISHAYCKLVKSILDNINYWNVAQTPPHSSFKY